MISRRLRNRWVRSERGSSLVELSLIVPVLIMVIFGTVDFGRAFAMGIELSSAAEAGALYGVNNPTDTSGIQTASQANASSISGLKATTSYGCECSDGSGAVASCSSTPNCNQNYVNYINVSTTANYNFLLKYPGLPSSLTMTSQSRMRVGGN
jgi:Flp pilus assembly protein TadG